MLCSALLCLPPAATGGKREFDEDDEVSPSRRKQMLNDLMRPHEVKESKLSLHQRYVYKEEEEERLRHKVRVTCMCTSAP